MTDYGNSLVAHRGFSSAYPENTLLAVQSALDLGARFIEVDFHLSVDGVPAVIHDVNLRRTAGADISVLDCTFASLQQFSVHEPQRFANRFSPQRIPSLHAVAELIRRHSNCTVFVEAKRASITRFGIDAVLDAVFPAITAMAGQCVLISFDHELLAAARQRALCPVGWVFENWNEQSFEVIDRLQPDYLFTDHASVPRQWEILPQGPWRWAVYTIDDAQLALHWFNKGAVLVETNSFGSLVKHPSLNIHS